MSGKSQRVTKQSDLALGADRFGLFIGASRVPVDHAGGILPVRSGRAVCACPGRALFTTESDQ